MIGFGMKIVFVQLGNPAKGYVWRNILQSKSVFPNHQHILISDHSGNLKKAKQLNIRTWEYKPVDHQERMLSSLEHDKNFRDGFWKLTLERLFALTNFLSSEGEESILHVESDVILSRNFPVDVLKNIQKILWLPFNESRDVPSLIYIPNPMHAEWLEKEILKVLEVDKLSTDMSVLKKIADKNIDKVGYFPTVESIQSQLLSHQSTSSFATNASMHFKDFSGIFDAAPIGMWLAGQDPRNNRGWIHRFQAIPESYIDPKQLKDDLIFDHDDLPYYQNIPLYNLHIHSKMKKYFGEANWKKLRREQDVWLRNKSQRTFSISAYLELALGFLKRRIKRF